MPIFGALGFFEGIGGADEGLVVDHVAVLAQDSFLRIGSVLPFSIGGLEREMVVVMIDLVARSAEVGLQVQRGFNAFMEPASAALRRLVRPALDQFHAVLRVHPGGQNEGAVLRFVASASASESRR